MTSAPHSARVEAVVLRHSDWGEADRLLTLFTLESGKLRAIAKGARKLRSRKAGHLEPFTRVALLLARGRDLWIVTQAQTVDAYLPLRDNLERTGYAAYIVELLDRFTGEEGPNHMLFRLLTDTLQRISEEQNYITAVHYYEIRLLDILGYRPDLFNCVGCGEEIIARDQFFSAEHGGVLCPNCRARDPQARPASMHALKYLRHYQRSGYAEASRVAIPTGIQKEVENLLQYYLTYLLERGLNTAQFLRDIRQRPQTGAPDEDEF